MLSLNSGHGDWQATGWSAPACGSCCICTLLNFKDETRYHSACQAWKTSLRDTSRKIWNEVSLETLLLPVLEGQQQSDSAACARHFIKALGQKLLKAKLTSVMFGASLAQDPSRPFAASTTHAHETFLRWWLVASLPASAPKYPYALLTNRSSACGLGGFTCRLKDQAGHLLGCSQHLCGLDSNEPLLPRLLLQRVQASGKSKGACAQNVQSRHVQSRSACLQHPL